MTESDQDWLRHYTVDSPNVEPHQRIAAQTQMRASLVDLDHADHGALQPVQWVYDSFADGAMYRIAPKHKL